MPVPPPGGLQERAPQEAHRRRLAREAWNQDFRLCSPGHQKRCGRRVLEWTEADASVGSDRAAGAVLTVAAGLTDGQPACVDWGDAGPCHAGHSDFSFIVARLTHIHATGQGVRERKGWTGSHGGQ